MPRGPGRPDSCRMYGSQSLRVFNTSRYVSILFIPKRPSQEAQECSSLSHYNFHFILFAELFRRDEVAGQRLAVESQRFDAAATVSTFARSADISDGEAAKIRNFFKLSPFIEPPFQQPNLNY